MKRQNVSGPYEPGGRGFESCRARQMYEGASRETGPFALPENRLRVRNRPNADIANVRMLLWLLGAGRSFVSFPNGLKSPDHVLRRIRDLLGGPVPHQLRKF